MKYRDLNNHNDLHYFVMNKMMTVSEAMDIEDKRFLRADQDLTEEDIDWFYGYGCFSDEVQQELDIKHYLTAVANGADWIDT